LSEVVLPAIKLRQQAHLANPESLALDAAHGTAFHRGLGETSLLTSSTPFESYLSTEALAGFAKGAYAKPNISIVSAGPASTEVSKWINQFFGDLPSSTAGGQFKPKESVPSKFYGGEQRIPSKSGNAVVIAFPGSAAYGASGYKPEAAVLASLLGGQSSIKWTAGFSLLSKATSGHYHVQVATKNHAYSDAGLFTITVTGKGDEVAAVSKNAVDVLKKVATGDVSSEDVNKAVALAKFRALEAAEVLETGLELTGSALINGGKVHQIGEIAQSFNKVSQQQVQEVSPAIIIYSPRTVLEPKLIRIVPSFFSSSPSLSSPKRPPWPPSETSTSCRSPRTLV
jgi:ubiquinol-cytochrome c reductase core subunit 2